MKVTKAQKVELPCVCPYCKSELVLEKGDVAHALRRAWRECGVLLRGQMSHLQALHHRKSTS